MPNGLSIEDLKKKTHKKKIRLLIVSLVSLAILVTGMFFVDFDIQADIEPEQEAYLPEISYSETDFQLKVEKLGINVPIIKDVNAADKEIYFEALEGGVAHMAGTPSPDEEGNVVIFGHSNFYSTSPGMYKKIFSTLDQLGEKDEIIVHYMGEDYQYQVENSQIVAPEDVWVITAEFDLTIVTCWPPGSIDNRLVVFANKKE